MDKKILVIPPTTQTNVRKRLREIGLELARQHQVYILHWAEAPARTLWGKAGACLRDIFRKSRIYAKDGFFTAEYPFFHRPLFMVKAYNPYSLGNFLRKYEIDAVINGMHYFFFTPDFPGRKVTHICDVNDLPESEKNTSLDRFMYDFAQHEIRKADFVTACSRGLVDYVAENFKRQAHFIPNGTHLEEFSSAAGKTAAVEIRKKYGLEDKFVLGYIGYVGEWIDLEFLIRFFSSLKQKFPDISLMIVGAGEKIAAYRRKIVNQDIIFTGGVSHKEIAPYFQAIDLGVLPSKINRFQDLAFHIKLIEYTAAGKMVLATPLEEIRRMEFPNIFTCELNVAGWLDAVSMIRATAWKAEWNNLVREYDWKNIAQKFSELIA